MIEHYDFSEKGDSGKKKKSKVKKEKVNKSKKKKKGDTVCFEVRINIVHFIISMI